MKKIVVLLISTLLLCGCQMEDRFDEGYDAGYENGLSDGEGKGYKDGYEEGYSESHTFIDDGHIYTLSDEELEKGFYLMTNYYPGMITFIDDTFSDSENAQELFDLCDKVGYCPSVILGDYCFDTSDWTVHLTDSDCIMNADKSCVCPCILYSCATRTELDQVIQTNTYLNDKGITYCPICFDE